MESYRDVKIYDAGNYYLIIGQTKTDNKLRLLKILKRADLIDVKEDFEPPNSEDLNMYLSNVLPKDNIRPVAEAEAILGVTRFLQGYYLYYISKSQKVGKIRDHSIYKIEETKLLKLFPEKMNGQEKRYADIFNSLDVTMGFYYSYTYDLTHTLQENITFLLNEDLKTPTPRITKRSKTQQHFGDLEDSECRKIDYYPWKAMYVWNHDQLISLLSALKDKKWITPIIHGFVGYHCLSMVGRTLDMLLIARRSKYFAGTRYLKRGLNEEGRVANDVEEEQIIVDKGGNGPMSSFVQVRGSIPLFWCQEPNPVIPPPAIILNQNDFLREGTRKHIADLFQRYGNPLILISLLRYQKKHKENAIAQEYMRCITYLNEHLPEKYKLRFYPFDIKTEEKSSRTNMMNKMYILARGCLDQTSLFTCKVKNSGQMKCGFQTGVIRTNCIDSIDRTNIAQMLVSRVALERQLKEMGFAQELSIDSLMIRLMSGLFEEMGDMIGLQYSGSEAHKGKYIQNKKKKKLFTAIKRHWANLITDPKKQQAMNLFLGVYKPSENNIPLWQIEDDSRLHNKIEASKRVYEKTWFKFEVSKFLKRLNIMDDNKKDVKSPEFTLRRVMSDSRFNFKLAPIEIRPKNRKRTRIYYIKKGIFTLAKSTKISYFEDKLSHSHNKIVEIPFYEQIRYETCENRIIEEKKETSEDPLFLKLDFEELNNFEEYLKISNKSTENFNQPIFDEEEFCVDLQALVQEAETNFDSYFEIDLSREHMINQFNEESEDEVSVILQTEEISQFVQILDTYLDSRPNSYAKIS